MTYDTTTEYTLKNKTMVFLMDAYRATYMFGICSGPKNSFEVVVNTMDSNFQAPTYSWPSAKFKFTTAGYDLCWVFIEPA